MSFDPPEFWHWFTSIQTLAMIWVSVALGIGCFLIARRILRGPNRFHASGVFGAALLLFISVCSWFVVVAWLLNRHV